MAKRSRKNTDETVQVAGPVLVEGTKNYAKRFVAQSQGAQNGSKHARLWPQREAPVEILERERAQSMHARSAVATDTPWEMAGPTNIGGRMTSVVCDPQNPDIVWGGSAGGGVWKSEDAGKTWQLSWDSKASLNIGALAMTADGATIYCGTGEANLSADSYAGVGIYRTTNGGESWMLLAPAASAGIPRRIGTIAIDPNDPQHIRIGGIAYNSDEPQGMYVSYDGGANWSREQLFSGTYWCHAIRFHPTDSQTIYATVTAKGSRSGIWRSKDGGQSWKQLRNGLPHPALFGRATLAIALSKPETLYCLSGRAGNPNQGGVDLIGGVLGLFRSDDGGDSWRDITTTELWDEAQMGYNNTIAVHPESEDRLICGGVDLHRTADGGTTWCKVTDWRAERGVDANYAHADHHALLIPTMAPDRIYDMNDGGMDVSDDGGRTWSNRSNGLAVTMFYDLDIAQSDGRFYGGGAQDNGTNVTVSGQADDFFMLSGGDGGWITIDPQEPGHVYTSWQNMNIVRFRNGKYKIVSPPAPEAERMWMVYMAMDPANTDKVLVGSNRIWMTENDGDTWTAISPNLDNSDVTAIEIAKADSQKIYVGTENGGFFRSQDGGASWTADLQGPLLPGRTITRIATRPDNADVIVLTVANFGHSHVYCSNDGGDTWQDLDRGELPDVPHSAIVIAPDAPDTIYVGNHLGVWSSTDFGQTWQDLTYNLPKSMVVDLVYHQADSILIAATYGRSLWRMKVS